MREGEGYRFGFCFLGRGLDLELGQIVSQGPFLFLFPLFSFSFSVFFISTNPFQKLIQIDLNQLCKVSKIRNNNPEQ
jgi:hypothetical protein